MVKSKTKKAASPATDIFTLVEDFAASLAGLSAVRADMVATTNRLGQAIQKSNRDESVVDSADLGGRIDGMVQNLNRIEDILQYLENLAGRYS